MAMVGAVSSSSSATAAGSVLPLEHHRDRSVYASPTKCSLCATKGSSFMGRRGERLDGRCSAVARDRKPAVAAGKCVVRPVVSATDKLGRDGGSSRVKGIINGSGLAVAMALLANVTAQGVAHAAEVSGNVALTDGVDHTSITAAIAGGGAIAAVAAALSVADPEKRRKQQASETGGDEMAVVRNYFNNTGFERWRKIYGETDEVNKVQMDIREGHAQTIQKVLSWLKADGLQGVTVCDVGCGTGSLSIPLALEGATVRASDISQSMVEEAGRRAGEALRTQVNGSAVAPIFEAKDLESVTGKYHTVACLDVLIHYPQERANDMVSHIASLADERIILSFAPKTTFYSILKRIGELFPGPSKATRAYLHAEDDVEAALKAAGWKVTRREMTATKFYFSRLLEATPIGS